MAEKIQEDNQKFFTRITKKLNPSELLLLAKEAKKQAKIKIKNSENKQAQKITKLVKRHKQEIYQAEYITSEFKKKLAELLNEKI
mmetsp:Transcript_13473/g.6644  ORF Transcript_13473/g.6644 Transcript_13473/m.6644 type:complete len:85 (-) Transcript_13473:358-612(-)